jgi:hypothetical protein
MALCLLLIMSTLCKYKFESVALVFCTQTWPTWDNEMLGREVRGRLSDSELSTVSTYGGIPERRAGGRDTTGKGSVITRLFPSDGLEKIDREPPRAPSPSTCGRDQPAYNQAPSRSVGRCQGYACRGSGRPCLWPVRDRARFFGGGASH